METTVDLLHAGKVIGFACTNKNLSAIVVDVAHSMHASLLAESRN